MILDEFWSAALLLGIFLKEESEGAGCSTNINNTALRLGTKYGAKHFLRSKSFHLHTTSLSWQASRCGCNLPAKQTGEFTLVSVSTICPLNGYNNLIEAKTRNFKFLWIVRNCQSSPKGRATPSSYVCASPSLRPALGLGERRAGAEMPQFMKRDERFQNGLSVNGKSETTAGGQGYPTKTSQPDGTSGTDSIEPRKGPRVLGNRRPAHPTLPPLAKMLAVCEAFSQAPRFM
ncbi:Gtpase-Activating Rap/Ran-Gap Domain-Like Protein 3 [Manis pentadactyla]|nr:Gtpase-Activating Rap/Ran-Gap Domain-Like Protein 3 [Manis pentadactyla]